MKTPRRAALVVVVTFGTALLLAPIAFLLFGISGAVIVAVFAAAIVSSLWLSEICASAFMPTANATAAMLTASVVRLFLPLFTALAVAIFARAVVPISAVVYVVPLYLSALVADTIQQLRNVAAGQDARVTTVSMTGLIAGERG
jgi:hypothetical protein